MRRRISRPSALVGAGAAAVLLLAGCVAAPSAPRTSNPSPSASVAASMVLPEGTPTDVVTGLEAPWSVVVGDGVTLVSERDSGDILQLDSGRTRVVGTVAGIRHGGEGGLLGMALDRDRRLYVYSTGADGNRIERYQLTGADSALALGKRTPILGGLPSSNIHNGGRIAFGPDGMLYASVGDAGVGGDAQDRSSMAGKILRMTPDGGVPADNPFDGSLVYSYGHRNVQGLGWAADGTMFASEFGQDTWDELNIIQAGKNYGWPKVEGRSDDPRFVDPVQQWRPAEASPSGLAVIGGTVFVANLRGQRVRAIPVADPSTATEYWTGAYGRIRAVLQGPDGALWVVTNNTDGRGTPRQGDDRILSVPLRPGA